MRCLGLVNCIKTQIIVSYSELNASEHTGQTFALKMPLDPNA